jgi:hypothetical protein
MALSIANIIEHQQKMKNEYAALVEWYWQGTTKVLGEETVLVSLCPPKLPHGLAWDPKQVPAAKGQWLTTWAMLWT